MSPAELSALSDEALRAEIDAAKSAADAYYWTFTRSRRGRPAPAHVHQRLAAAELERHVRAYAKHCVPWAELSRLAGVSL